MSRHSVTFVVMAGGKGERLWPLVRTQTPKVCLSLNGRGSLLGEALARLRPAWPKAQWLIVTTRSEVAAIRASVRGSLRPTLLVEPEAKNTAACMTLAAATVARRDPKGMMVVMPADHWIGDVRAFQRAIRTAIRAATTYHTLVTIGVRPTHPHPGLGYLCAGGSVGRTRGPRVFQLNRFIEKPSRRVAQQLIRQSKTYWNIGIFIGQAQTFLDCVDAWLPQHTRRLVPLAMVDGHQAFQRRAASAYRPLKAVSFDRGVMRRLDRALVVEGKFPWADLGSWDAWARIGRSVSRTLGIESHNVTVIGQEDHLVATIGVRDLLVVHTPTATLICRPDNTQAVREIVKRLSSSPKFASYR